MVSVKTALLALAAPILCLAALPTTNQIEVRSTGADTNGGCYAALDGSGGGTAGTDYSIQDSPHVAFNGTTITAVTAGVSATITISGYTVATTDSHNCLQITGGTNFTTGVYYISSVNVGANTWTLDRNVSTGVGAAMTGNMGGGFLTIAQALSIAVQGNASSSGVANAGNTIWIKKGTYTVTTKLLTPSFPTVAFPLTVSGYNASHGDNPGVASGNQPTVTTATNSIDLWDMRGDFVVYQYLKLSNTAGTKGNGFVDTISNPNRILIAYCRITGFAIGIASTETKALTVFASEIDTNTSHGLSLDDKTVLYGNYIHDNGGDGALINDADQTTTSYTFIRNVFYKNNIGIATSGTQGNANQETFINNDVTDSTSDGMRLSYGGASALMLLQGNVLYNNGGWGVNFSFGGGTFTQVGSAGIINLSNAYGANTSGTIQGASAGTGDVTLTADPFTARTSGNFALNSTAGGGAALKALSYPGIIPDAGTGFSDIGALQSQASSGGSNSAYAQ